MNIQSLMGLAFQKRFKLAGAVFCMTITAIATASYAYLVGPMLRALFLQEAIPLESVQNSGIFDTIMVQFEAAGPWGVGIAIVCAAAVKGAAHFGQSVLVGRAGSELLFNLRNRLYRGLLLTNPFGAQVQRGDWVTRFTVDVNQLEQAVTKGVVAYIRNLLQIVALAGLAIALDPLLGGIGLLAFPPIALLIVRIGKKLRHRREQVHRALGEVGGQIDETAGGLPIIQSFDANGLMESRFEQHSMRVMRAAIGAVTIRALSSPINEILGAGALAITLIYASDRISSGVLRPEAFISFFSALFLLYQPVKGMGQAHHAVQSGLAALGRVASILSLKDIEVPRSFVDGADEVRVIGGASKYSNSDLLLRNIDITLRKGERVGLVGRSGCGKTSLLNLMEGFIPLLEGEMLVDGCGVEPSRIKGLFASVRQEPFLFNDTIGMNVRCGRWECTDADIHAACGDAGVFEFAGEEKGVSMEVGPYGEGLSVGQRQRVCLARAVISGAPFLLLDEVTASLDGKTENELVGRLEHYMADRGVLMVTHRLSSAQNMDRIIYMESGTVCLDGPADEVLKQEKVRALFGDQ